MSDHYTVLGVSRDADEATIKAAFRQLARKHHPDVAGGDAEKFKEITAAHDVLSDKTKRARYDQYGDAMSAPDFAGFASAFAFQADFGDSVADMFGDAFGGSDPRPRQSEELLIDVRLEFMEAALGCTKRVSYSRKERCSSCRGTGARPGTSRSSCGACKGRGSTTQPSGFFQVQVECVCCRGSGQVVTHPCVECTDGLIERKHEVEIKIPAGVDEGMSLRVPSDGSRGGALKCVARIRPHPVFSRNKTNVTAEVKIPFVTAVLGGTTTALTLDGDTRVEVRAGTQQGDTLVIHGKGIADVRTKKRGDLILTFGIDVPKKVTKEQEALLRSLARTGLS